MPLDAKLLNTAKELYILGMVTAQVVSKIPSPVWKSLLAGVGLYGGTKYVTPSAFSYLEKKEETKQVEIWKEVKLFKLKMEMEFKMAQLQHQHQQSMKTLKVYSADSKSGEDGDLKTGGIGGGGEKGLSADGKSDSDGGEKKGEGSLNGIGKSKPPDASVKPDINFDDVD